MGSLTSYISYYGQTKQLNFTGQFQGTPNSQIRQALDASESWLQANNIVSASIKVEYVDGNTKLSGSESYTNLGDNKPNDIVNNSTAQVQPEVKQADNRTLDDNQPPATDQPKSNESQGTLGNVTVTATQTQEEAPTKRQQNPLSQYSSYTYNFSLYAITPDAYNNWVVNGKWITKDLELLVQSGGVNSSLDSRRNRFFNLDFTIDDVEIISLINGKSTRVAGNQSNFKFKIYEPYGMTFPTRLVRAQAEIQQQANIKRDIKQPIQAISCPLLLVVRFYGYDENGKLVKNLDSQGDDYTKTDSNSNFERAFPINISKFNFRMDNKVTVYDVEAKMMNEQIGFGVQRGIVKSGFEIAADNVANAIQQLLDKVNNQQELMCKKSDKQKYPDVYKVSFEDKSGIGESLIVEKDFYVKSYTPITQVTNINQVNDRLSNSGNAKTVSKDNRSVKIAEGTTVLTAIDQIITQSTFVKNVLDELDKEVIEKKQQQDSTTVEVSDSLELYWYTVVPTNKIINWDDVRYQYAQEITYNIKKYRVSHIQSLYLNKTIKYPGPYKIYDYYYSGKNTEIIDFQINYNLLYYNIGVLSSNAKNKNNNNDVLPNSQEPGQNADPTNQLPGSRELTNSLKTYLYSPTDQLNSTLTILGDPDYLMPSQAGSLENIFKLWYGQDLTINPSSGQVFIEIGFKQVQDYSMDDGILDPDGNIKFWIYPEGSEIEKRTQGRMVYMLNTVTNKFHNGIFKQEIKGVIPSFANQPGSTGGGLRADENQSQAEVNRLLRAGQSRPNIVAKPKPAAGPNNNGISSSPAGMKNYVGRATSAQQAQQQVKDDNSPKTSYAKGTQVELRESAKRAEENARRLNIKKLDWFR